MRRLRWVLTLMAACAALAAYFYSWPRVIEEPSGSPAGGVEGRMEEDSGDLIASMVLQ